MSKRRGKSPVLTGVRECQYCGRRVQDDCPLFLVAVADGRIVGPFHPACAVTVLARQAATHGTALPPGMPFGRVVPNAIQEELL